MIGFKVKAILGAFWVDANQADQVEVMELEIWMNALEECSISEINAAWNLYLQAGPRTDRGKLCKPDAGYLWRIITSARDKGWPQANPGKFIEAIFKPKDDYDFWTGPKLN